ncbi:MAG: ParB/RepB/Spo0J family partition protein [Myxococcaceae bacterium]|jgi:ParB family chromosome partitioning protein|nr:ParB/RepB/Spo0J family partition protein [Myxococcaceae bacterium]
MPGVVKVLTTANRKPALGRGLGALLQQEARPPAAAPGGVTRLPLDQIHADRANPRKTFDEAALEELAVSLKHQGVLQPVLVRRDSRGGYRLIAGERRWRAAQRAGLREIPAIVREASDAEAYELALVENIQRADLNPLEEAEAFRRLLDERRLSQEQVADRVGKDRSTVANALRLLALPNEVKQLLAEGDLDMGHARALLGLTRAADIVTLARAVVTDKLTVREVEARVKGLKPATATPSRRGKGREKSSPEARRLVEDLQRRLGTKVRLVEKGAGKGSLEIDYFSFEDLERIIGLIKR